MMGARPVLVPSIQPVATLCQGPGITGPIHGQMSENERALGVRGAGSRVARMRDEDDWVGTPPEGRHSRDRADPGFWQNQWQPAAAGAVLFVLVVIALLVALL